MWIEFASLHHLRRLHEVPLLVVFHNKVDEVKANLDNALSLSVSSSRKLAANRYEITGGSCPGTGSCTLCNEV